MIKNIIKKIFNRFGYTIIRKGVRMDFVAWAKDSEFESASSKVESFSLLGRDRLFMLWQFARQAKLIGGAMAQVGVFRGGSARLIAYAKGNSSDKFYLFDTFKGMPKVDKDVDLHKEGDFQGTSLEGVKKVFSDASNVVFCPGVFPQTSDVARSDAFSFVYIDVDIYKSVADSLAFFYPRMKKGAFMVFDDYMGKHTPGVKKALDEFLYDKTETPIITTVGQCLIIKQ